ncbi:hypothetical protein SPSIL_015180 [Sporomusa silvacetica DSM 10669]|uniref:Uncharacterized protein n=1 Tax=Sporomusa silvacetica DSM 10669 TaxID=1123289 RepID=A0ABZ3IJ25_9FIRM|nr:hypothetical protein [Sporomusa silvacetica]OZC21580.1 hypothetical protein SPSIL_09910 [Sporomusa silvacetica DSM 10669]
MNTSDIISAVRYKVGFVDFTDYQITESLNYVIREISLALNSITSSLITTSTTLTLTDNTAPLPTDLETIISVTDKVNIPITDELSAYTYQIVGNTIQAQGDTVTIYYKKTLPEYSFDGEIVAPTTIDLPNTFSNMIIDNIAALLGGQAINIQTMAIKLVANRDGKKRAQRLIFTM